MAVAIFLYVGAEVAVASIMINFLVHIDFGAFLVQVGFVDALARAGMLDPASSPEEIAGKTLGLCYWGGAMVGRFVGSWLLTKVNAGALLAVAATVAVGALLPGFAIERADRRRSGTIGRFLQLDHVSHHLHTDACTIERADAFGLRACLCMAIVGGAAIPPLTGLTADMIGL